MQKTTTLARIGAGSTMLLIAVGLFFGRGLEASFPAAAKYLPLAALAVCAGIAAFATAGSRQEFAWKRVLLPLLVVTAALIALEFSIRAPIERIHLLKYGSLAAFLSFSFIRPPFHPSLIGFVGAATIGVVEECSQLLLPDRVFDLRDIALNLAGSALGSLAAWASRRPARRTLLRRREKLSSEQ
ncbi:MAG: VanZ family protein [Bdellovibrionales bacterium]|nr:VanZ family protein [Bdellovibrionales bacterium]